MIKTRATWKLCTIPIKKRRVSHSPTQTHTHLMRVLLLHPRSWLLRRSSDFLEQHMLQYRLHSCTPRDLFGWVAQLPSWQSATWRSFTNSAHPWANPTRWCRSLGFTWLGDSSKFMRFVGSHDRFDTKCYGSNLLSVITSALSHTTYAWTYIIGSFFKAIRVRATWNFCAILIKSAEFHTKVGL